MPTLPTDGTVNCDTESGVTESTVSTRPIHRCAKDHAAKNKIKRKLPGQQSAVVRSISVNMPTLPIDGTVNSDTESDVTESTASTVHIYMKDHAAKNKKNTKLLCFFCGGFFYQMKRHLERINGEETNVTLAVTSRDKLGLKSIINQGIYKHNLNVLRAQDGVLMVACSPARNHGACDFMPCQFCLQFFIKRELYRHCRECMFRVGEGTGAISNGRALLDGSLTDNFQHTDKSMRSCVIKRMRIDHLMHVVKCDNLILKLGLMLFNKLGDKRAFDISTRMRELARVLIILQKSDPTGQR
jgi:hypothetical protein